ncbi:hypothetical protein LOD99_7919 [Oopsacas minuta]|uniref:OTU domain-containing protein n=1 Tax=Oopsacas minuta TaxID=111878 RepID=A0AAV7JIN2_9METZ|nr:hypothetical protein LOD99_7919 [Oopsacas minuta]
MISSGHTSAEISYFLHKWYLDTKKILGYNINIGQVEIDFSWALIHSVCNAFLKCDIDTYLDKCWNRVDTNSANQELELKLILHLCSAHIMHGIGFHINRKFKLKKEVRKLFLYSFGYLVRCTNITQISCVFTSLCYVFKSKYMNEHVLSNIKTLEYYISDSYSDLDDTNESLYDEDCDNDPIDIKDGKTLRDRSPFGKHFAYISKQCENAINNNHTKTFDSNPCYYPSLIEYILTYYLPILPLWSGIILGPHSLSVGNNYSYYSNAIVENWMRIVKLDILNSKSNLRPGDFIRVLYPGITSRISAFNFTFHPRADKFFKGRKRIRDISEEKCNEEWSRKKKQHCGYLKSKTYEFPQFNRDKTIVKDKLIPIKRQKLSTLRMICKSPEIKTASIITDEELVESSIIRYIIPSFRPPHVEWQIATCKKWKLHYSNQIVYSLDNLIDNGEGLYVYNPGTTETISGDGNCYFSTISYLITGSKPYHKNYGKLSLKTWLVN